MSSIIPGYEYDIFISYRQKDNKYDNWVTEFVDHLKREIDATFKEDISIYFDENPHDGLLEIHNVDKSLANKLRSVIFMPIISQTYVDFKSFAWQNEFMAFNKISLEDKHGRDIKLLNGNVCSRIIPIKIHELDALDTEMIEKELGSRLRSIDFIYSSSGVNRPLKPYDNPDKNLNKTYYRDQINKVANTVKEIIYGLHPDPGKRGLKSKQTGTSERTGSFRTPDLPERESRLKKASYATIILATLGILTILAIVIFNPGSIIYKRASSQGESTERRTIAVMPVSNLTGNPDLDYIADGIQDDMTGKLGALSSFDVRPRASTLQFKGTNESVQQMAKKLNVNTMIESSIKGSENNLRIEVRLIEAFPEEKYVWNGSFIQSWEKIGEIYQEIIKSVINGTKVKLTSREAGNLQIVQKHDPELLKACAKGKYYMNLLTQDDFERGLKFYNEAISIDPSDPLPYIGLALGYSTAGHVSSVASDASSRAIGYARQALALDSTLIEAADAYVVLATRSLYTDWDFPATERYLKRAMELNPNAPMAHYHYGWYRMLSNDVDGAVSEFRRSIEIDPVTVTYTANLASLYWWIGKPQEAMTEAEKALQLDPNYPMALAILGSSYAEMGMFDKAIEAHNKGIAVSPDFEASLGVTYARASMRNKALEVAAKLEKTGSYWYTWGIAEIYATLGDSNKAIYWIEEAYKNRHDFTPWFKYNCYFKPLANDPRFIDIIKRLNLPDK